MPPSDRSNAKIIPQTRARAWAWRLRLLPTMEVGEAGEYPPLDNHATRSWHFPLNKAKRQYQFDIIQQALLCNTLVALPTGLGKTFIAAVVMYNFYRWFPTGSIVFMAPTRPLVTQQLEATLGTVEIDPALAVEMTGGQSPTQRQLLWREKRVFFLTPQVLQNDLISGICPARKLVLLVFDEAHRAMGNHAYCDVVRFVCRQSSSWKLRVLALTATPASDAKTIQNLIDNLLLSSIAIRSEESPDVKSYLHEKTVETLIVPESEDIKFIRVNFEDQIIRPYLDKLYQMGVISESEPSKLGSYQLIQARDAMRTRNTSLLSSTSRAASGVAEGLFPVLISLYHSYELLLSYGIVTFKTSLCKPPDDPVVLQSRIHRELNSTPAFIQLLSHLESLMSTPGFTSHPKLGLVERTLLMHFSNAVEDTRAIIFSNFRESVYEIASKLERHAPLLRVMAFVGQLSAVGERQVTQKQQTEVKMQISCMYMRREEGLDIGNVDLIICFDVQSSPIRMLQRTGRTGRHRDGRIVLLMSAGIEEQRYQRTISKHRAVQRAIENSKSHFVFYRPEQPLLPTEPTCIERTFNLSSNHRHLEKSTMAIATKQRPGKTSKAPPVLDNLALSEALLEQIHTPSLGSYLGWQKIPSVSFVIPHSHSTIRLCRLFSEFESLDDLPEGPSAHKPEAARAPNAALVSNLPPNNPLMNTMDGIEDLMLQAISEMSRYVKPRHIPSNWASYQSAFDKFFKAHAALQGPAASALPFNPSMAHARLPIIEEYRLPDDFFDDPITDPVGMDDATEMYKTVVSPLKFMAIDSAAVSPPKHAVGSPDSPMAKVSICPSQRLSAAPMPAHVDSSQGKMPFLPQRRQYAAIIETSSNGPSPEDSAPQYGRRAGGMGLVSKFVNYEAECSDDMEDDGEDEDASCASIASFIDDRSEVTIVESSNDSSDPREDCSAGPPSSDEMMAFYRRTALQSQVDPRFKTAPRQFSIKTKLKFQAVTDLTLSESDPARMIDATPFDDIDRSSDLGL